MGGSGRRFSGAGLVHAADHRSLEADMDALAKLRNAADADALAKHRSADVETRQRDAHYKNKYPPQHAATLVNTNCSRQQARTPRHVQQSQCTLAEQAGRVSFASAESLETMSESDVPLGFSRMNRLRQSLPLARSPSQAKLRAPGVLFLQFGDETRRVHITHELTSLETLHALIVHMFPQKLTMGALRSPGTAILVKDETRNVFYELEDPRDVQDRCVIKIYCREPPHRDPHRDPHYGTHAQQHTPHPQHAPHGHHGHIANGDLRRELVYTSRESSPTRRLNTLPSSSPPSSGSPSRPLVRLSYTGGRPSSYAGPPPSQQQPHPYQHAPHQHHAHSGGGGGGGHAPQQSHPHTIGYCPSPSAILERRDVKPDEEVTSSSSKSVVLLKSDGVYADPYALLHEGGGRLSLASPQAALYRRGSVRSLSSYSAAALQAELEGALYRPGGPLYAAADPYATIGGFHHQRSLSQGSPPHKAPDGRDPYVGQPGRASPGRQAFRKDPAGFVVADGPKSRSGSGSDQLCVLGGPGGEGGGGGMPGYCSPLPGNETETRDRMEAMEKQIASLTGLVQSVLTRGPDSPEKVETASDCSATETLTPTAPLALMPPPPTGDSQPITVSRSQMQHHLSDLQTNTSELRRQLSQLRKLQLQNQDSVAVLLRQTESELGLCLMDAMRTQEDPLQRQRLLVEEERLRYLNEEELIIQQLHDLERSVEEMQSGAGFNHRLVTEQEVEQKSLELRRLGETLTDLKNQFPSLQSKMRVVLRVEVEAVKFLKEEPLRLDALLKRCRLITDTLTLLRRQVTEAVWKGPEDFASSVAKQLQSELDFGKSSELDALASPGLSLADLGATFGSSGGLANWMPGVPAAAPEAPVPEQDTPAAGATKSRGLDEPSPRRDADKAVSVEVRLAAERDWEEKRASLTQFSTQDINRLLEETQAELLRAIPDLDYAARQINKPAVPPKPPKSLLGHFSTPASATSTPTSTPEHQPCKPQPPKLASQDGAPRRGSAELTVPRYRTEKPSKSPPPPPPRRSFPSAHGLTTNRSGEVIVTSKSVKKLEKVENSEETDAQTLTPPVKLRRPSASDAPRPASTPPVIAASGVKDDEDDEEKIIAELESAANTSGSGKALQSSAASRLKHLQQSSLERRGRKQREDFPKLQQGQQQVFHF